MPQNKKHIHFIGIGGIGMSALAHILKSQGYTVSGCDKVINQPTITHLKTIGCTIYEGNGSTHCFNPDITTFVYSTDIHFSAPELIKARERNVPILHRAALLANLMNKQKGIAISGSHGKTTTSALIAHVLIETGLDPTFAIGGILKNSTTNAHLGTGDYFVAEADESDRSVLSLRPHYLVITNIDLEHMDTYQDIEDIKNTFAQCIAQLPKDGTAFLCVDDSNTRSLVASAHRTVITYGTTNDAHLQATNIILESDHSTFTVVARHDGKTETYPITMPLPGIHNVLNSLAAIAVGQAIALPLQAIAKALSTFLGVERRFSFRGTYLNASVFDDYGHHPTEIEKTLVVARQKTKGKLIVLFQLHRYSRTRALWNEFIQAFLAYPPDHLIITDIYPAGEVHQPTVSGELFAQALQARNPGFMVEYRSTKDVFSNPKQLLEPLINDNDLILLQGAGTIYTLAQLLI